jgi:hypothetical protein
MLLFLVMELTGIEVEIEMMDDGLWKESRTVDEWAGG